jgi:serine protease AprX
MGAMLNGSNLPARLFATLAALLAGVIASASLAAMPAPPRPPSGSSAVIVRGEAGALAQLERSTVLAGGSVVRDLAIINGFSARIPTERLAAIRELPGVVAVSPDSMANFHSAYDPAADPNSMASTAAAVGADAAWSQGITGAGVDVAVLDSGVTPVQGLAGAGQVVNGPDLSFDSQTPSVRYLDGFGHGTFMAGLIAGRDADYKGIAPDARIVNVKVGAANGAVDVSQVIAGIDWVVQHRHDNGLNIRVLNLSLGTHSSQDYRIDPLAFAAEVAWRAGIVVVVAAGNDGASTARLNDPAIDPFVLAVGATGSHGPQTAENSFVALFSSIGNEQRGPDLVAPGSHIQGLRVPGSYIDQRYPGAAFGGRFFRGSGTSEAAAITSGAVALLLQQSPSLTPGQVKAILMRSAQPLAESDNQSAGSGLLRAVTNLGEDLSSILDETLSGLHLRSRVSPSIGTGSLEAARGDSHVSLGGVALTGEKDIFGRDFSSPQVALLTALQRSWTGGTWNGTTWTGTTWSGTTWSGTTWSGTTWSGTTWSGTTWSGTTWTGTTWTGTTWSGTTWTGTTWTGDIWNTVSWS